MTVPIATLNHLDREAFRRTLGGIFEQSPWVADGAFDRRPFPTLDALHATMVDIVRSASRPAQLALIRAHPDLAGKAARATMSTASVAEQASAGLDRLTDDEYERFERLNRAYRDRFGFPFVIAVRRHDKRAILSAFEARLRNTVDDEIATALAQIGEIARLRLETLAGSA